MGGGGVRLSSIRVSVCTLTPQGSPFIKMLSCHCQGRELCYLAPYEVRPGGGGVIPLMQHASYTALATSEPWESFTRWWLRIKGAPGCCERGKFHCFPHHVAPLRRSLPSNPVWKDVFVFASLDPQIEFKYMYLT